MNNNQKTKEFDAIVVGSGASGATVARELSRQNKRVLILERGGYAPLKEGLVGIARIADEVKLGDDEMSTVRAVTTGGSTCMYFAVVAYPPINVFGELGIDLTEELHQVKTELPIAALPEGMITPQMKCVRDSALSLGYDWRAKDLLVDAKKCVNGYSYHAKWNARTFIDDATQNGATLVNHAAARRVIVDKDVAIGVEYTVKNGFLSSEVARAYGRKIVLAAGELASPMILRDSGVSGVGDRGFYCNPGYAIYGIVPELKGISGFCGAMACEYEDGIELGDANIPKSLHRPMMLGGLKVRQFFNFPKTIGIGVKISDGFGGELSEDGAFHKTFGKEERLKLDKGKQEAIRILKNAGAKHITDFGVTAAGRVGGLVRIGEHLGSNLESCYRNLHVCDGSVIPEKMRGPPALTLVCLSKYLSKQLLSEI